MDRDAARWAHDGGARRPGTRGNGVPPTHRPLTAGRGRRPQRPRAPGLCASRGRVERAEPPPPRHCTTRERRRRWQGVPWMKAKAMTRRQWAEPRAASRGRGYGPATRGAPPTGTDPQSRGPPPQPPPPAACTPGHTERGARRPHLTVTGHQGHAARGSARWRD